MLRNNNNRKTNIDSTSLIEILGPIFIFTKGNLQYDIRQDVLGTTTHHQQRSNLLLLIEKVVKKVRIKALIIRRKCTFSLIFITCRQAGGEQLLPTNKIFNACEHFCLFYRMHPEHVWTSARTSLVRKFKTHFE